jgi:cell division protein FtsQ
MARRGGPKTPTTDGRGRRVRTTDGAPRRRTVAERVAEEQVEPTDGGRRPAAATVRAQRIREERAVHRDRLLPDGRADRGGSRAEPEPPKPKRRNDLRFRIRRRIALAVAVLAVLALLGGGFWAALVYTGIAEVEQVEVTGALVVPQEAITAAAAVETGVPLATVDTKAIAQRVAQLPGVGSAQVSRGWPHTVAIEVTERTAVALARTPQGVTLVDASGVAYQQAPEVPPVLPMLGFGAVGPDDPATRAALAVLAALPQDLRAQVQTIDVDSPAVQPTVRLGLGDRQVRFGTPDRAAEKVAKLVPLLTQDGTVYDVSSPDLPTITR